MSDDETTDRPADASISVLTRRLEEIIDWLEDGEVSLERAKALHSEGRTILEDLKAALDIGKSSVEVRD